MVWLLLFVVLVVGGLVVLFGAAGWATLGMAATDDKRARQLEADPAAALEALFDGSPQVVYAPQTRHGLSTATLVRAAGERGYRMVSEQGVMATRQVVFERV